MAIAVSSASETLHLKSLQRKCGTSRYFKTTNPFLRRGEIHTRARTGFHSSLVISVLTDTATQTPASTGTHCTFRPRGRSCGSAVLPLLTLAQTEPPKMHLLVPSAALCETPHEPCSASAEGSNPPRGDSRKAKGPTPAWWLDAQQQLS